jgi:CBS domain-containing protein
MADVKIGDIMRKAVITVKKNDTMDKVVKIMAKAGIGGVIVTDEGKVTGIITEKDIIRDILAQDKNLKKVRVKNIMKHPVRTVLPETDIEKAMEIMRDLDIERLPVVKKGRLIGLVTARDITKVEPAMLEMARQKEAAFFDPLPKEGFRLSITGECETCGNYSEYLKDVKGRLICEDCREEP